MYRTNNSPFNDYRIKFELLSLNMSRSFKQIQFFCIGERSLLGFKKIDYYNEVQIEIFFVSINIAS